VEYGQGSGTYGTNYKLGMNLTSNGRVDISIKHRVIGNVPLAGQALLNDGEARGDRESCCGREESEFRGGP